MAAIDKILRKSNFTAAMTALIAKLNGLFVRKEDGKVLSSNDYTNEEKDKLAGVADGANKYVLPAATSSVLGGVKAGENVTISEDGTISAVQGTVDLTPYAKKSDLTTVYKYRGSVDTYADLPTNGQAVGDVYNVVAADSANGVNAGDNLAWNGNTWDNLSGVVDLSAYIKAADADGKYMQINDFPLATDDEIVAIVNDTVK